MKIFIRLFIFFIVTINNVEAHRHILAGCQEVTHIPPVGYNLLQDERCRQDAIEQKQIRSIVEDVVKNTQQQKNMERVTTVGESNKKTLPSKAMYDLLDKVYDDAALKEDTMAYHFKDISIREALKTVGTMSDIPLIIDGDVTGRVEDLIIEKCSFGKGLSILLNNNVPRLSLVKEDDVFRVVTRATALELLYYRAKEHEYQDYHHAIVTIHNAKWDDCLKKRIEEMWKGVVGTDEKHKKAYIVFDDSCKKIIFWGLHDHVALLEHYICEIDCNVPQIRIDIRVVMASKSFEDSFGVQWSGVYDQSASLRKFNFVGLGPITDSSDAGHEFFKNLITWAVNILPPNVSSPALHIPIVFGDNDLSTNRLNLLLNASENKNQIKTLLKPSLLVSSEECAEILVGEELPQETRLDEAIEGKLTNVTTTHYKDIGMKIRVKPVANASQKSVFLDVYVENSSVVPRVLSNGSSSSTTKQFKGLFDYTIETARSKSHAVLKSGQTTMIGGLMTHVREKDKTGIPLLKDIPILGWFFKGRRTKLVDKQLMIFITPTVI